MGLSRTLAGDRFSENPSNRPRAIFPAPPGSALPGALFRPARLLSDTVCVSLVQPVMPAINIRHPLDGRFSLLLCPERHNRIAQDHRVSRMSARSPGTGCQSSDRALPIRRAATRCPVAVLGRASHSSSIMDRNESPARWTTFNNFFRA